MTGDLQQRIRERAYEIWENEGCPEGRDCEHWQQACAEFADAKAEAAAQQPQETGQAGSAAGAAGESTAAGPAAQGQAGKSSSKGDTAASAAK